MGVWNDGMNNVRIPLSSWKFTKVKPFLRQFRATPLFTFFPCDSPETKWSAIKVIRISIDFLRNHGPMLFVVPMLQTRGTSNLPRDFHLLSNLFYDSSTSLTISSIILEFHNFLEWKFISFDQYEGINNKSKV